MNIFYNRKQKSDEELIDDPECIGNMKLNGEPKPDKKSLIYSYKFEDQEFKLRKSKETVIANNLDVVKITSSKFKTYKFLKKINIPTVSTYTNKKKLNLRKILTGLLNLTMVPVVKRLIYLIMKKI